MSESKIEIKIGEFSFSGMGSEEWLAKRLDQIMERAESLINLGASFDKHIEPSANQNCQEGIGEQPKTEAPLAQLSTNTIASRFQAKTCKDLAFCAILHLHFFLHKQSFSYDEIRSEMKTAKSFYKTSMKGGNFQAALDGLVKDRKINECGSKQYALCAPVISEMEAQLAAA